MSCNVGKERMTGELETKEVQQAARAGVRVTKVTYCGSIVDHFTV